MNNTRWFLKPIRAAALLLAMSAAAVATTWAQSAQPAANSIEAINVAGQRGGSIVVRITLKQPLADPPAGFTINNPPRIAFDFPGTSNALGKNTQEVGDGDLRNMNIVQAGERTRLVMNLSKLLAYDTKIDGRNVIITLQPVATGTAATPVTLHFAEAKVADTRHSLRDVSFRRGPNGEGRIIVDLSDNAVGIDLRQQGRSLIIDFQNTALPKNLERRLDVVDFATPVQTVDMFMQGSNSRIAIEPKGLWEHSAYQTDKRFIVEVKPVVEDPTKLIQGTRRGYTGEKLSLNFQNVEVRAVLQVIADFTGFNFITSDTVTGNLTLRLKDVPWDQALDIILQAKGLDMRKNGNVVWIAPSDELATKEKLALEAQAQIADLEPTRTESFQLNYQKAEAFQNILAHPTQRILSKRGSVVPDVRTNTLFVQDTPSRLEAVRALVRKIDVPVRQVMIESRIVEASDNFSRNLGARLGIADNRFGDTLGGKAAQRVTVGGSLDATGFLTNQLGTPIPFGTAAAASDWQRTLGVNLPAAGISGANPGVFSVILFNEALTRFLNLEVSALQADGKGKIISSPRVITADQVEATIEQGTEIPYQQATSSGATSVAFKKATLSLKVKPQITPDDNIIMNLNVHKDSVGVVTTAGPSIDTKQITTEVLVQNGGTVVIGGIYTQDESNTTTKVPVLGDIPYVGFLFRQNAKTDNKSELLIFISPRIIKSSVSLR
ncbi:MAG: type IV pilus secretin PilQ [Betaproteobacteria bacterium]|nr:type IV pilus secretin PilQ [Betaproteobacteria bacterium]